MGGGKWPWVRLLAGEVGSTALRERTSAHEVAQPTLPPAAIFHPCHASLPPSSLTQLIKHEEAHRVVVSELQRRLDQSNEQLEETVQT